MRQMPEQWPQVEGAYRPRNGARTPMQWSRERNLGFSTASAEKLYLPLDPAADDLVVSTQESDPTSLLNRTRKLIALRHTEPALAAYAEFVPLCAEKGKYPFIYARAKGEDLLLVVLNPSRSNAEAEFALNRNFSRTTLIAGKPLDIVRHESKVHVAVLERS